MALEVLTRLFDALFELGDLRVKLFELVTVAWHV